MNIVLVAATELEFSLLKNSKLNSIHSIDFKTHGVGMLLATYHLLEIANKKPDLIIQVGIAGTFDHSIQIGDVTIVEKEFLGDTGAENKEEFLSIHALNFIGSNDFPFTESALINKNKQYFPSHLKKVNAITVNTSSGHNPTIDQRKLTFLPQIESMEGACLHYICLQKNIPFIQFRGISNVIEPRNKDNWNIPLAVKNSQEEVMLFLESLNKIA